MQETYSIKIDKNIENNLLNYLLENQWMSVLDKNEYIKYKYNRGKSTVTIYTSMKLVVQGYGKEYSDILALLDASKSLENADEVFVPHIGADEVGKGDYFGPLIVAACYIPEENINDILNSGIKDSKKLTDKKIVEIYKKISNKVIYNVTALLPKDYNSQYKKISNIAILLSQLHKDNIVSLIDKIPGKEYNSIVIDQFSTRKDRLESVFKGYKLSQFHHAESKDITVATASVIARYYFIQQMNEMNEKYSFEFPYGSTNVVESAKQFIKQYGEKELVNVVKLSFSTTQKVLHLL